MFFTEWLSSIPLWLQWAFFAYFILSTAVTVIFSILMISLMTIYGEDKACV